MKTRIVWLLMALTFMLSASQVPTRAATNSTSECGAINTDTTWSLANSPYAVCVGGVTVASGATLTLEPGVVVQFQQSAGNKLNVQGALDATGTPTQPITFTGVVTTPGSWGGLNIDGTVITPALASLSNVTLDYGGIYGSFGAQVYADRAVVTMTHSLIRNSAGNGLYTTLHTLFDVHSTRFVSNSLNAIQLNQPTTDLLMTDLSASGNGVDGVRVAGTTPMPGPRRWMFPGIPYIVDGPVSNVTGDVLTIDPGNELRFMSSGWLSIGGQLNAIGLPDQPITFTSQTKLPGDWRGIFVYGSTIPAVAQLDYTTVEYGGNDIHGANIEVGDGMLIAHHSIIRYSSQDGVRFDANAGGSILNSQIFSNSQIVSTTYGVYNFTPTRAILATNNWWGDANGPTSDLAACSTGHGDRVTTGVLFRPVLTDTQTTAPFPLSDAPILTLTPRRWFAPADNTTRVYFDITLRDGNGAPLPGGIVKLSTSLGTAKDGGITDLNGKTLAYLVSNSVGDADVTAALDAATTCEGAPSPTTKVTFTPPLTITDLLPNAPASYFDGDISVTPLPVVTGVTTTIQARLTNPLSVPITVDVSFGFVQSSIGLAFGPIKDILGQVIPANSSVALTAPFMPIVSGHYCVQVTYNITAIGSARVLRPQSGGRQLKQFNLNVQPGPMGPPNDKDILDKADKSWNQVSKLSPSNLKIQKAITDGWWGWAKDAAKSISQALGFDPPRQDYNQTTLPIWHTWPTVQPGPNVSTARAAAINAASAALADVNAYGTVATVALDRYGGASEANDLAWAAQQANARLYYQQKMGGALLTYADNLDAFVQVLVNEGETEITVTVSDVISYQQRLAATGFTTQEIADAKLIGLTDADIEEFRQGIIAANPSDIAGNVLTFYTSEAAISRQLGNALLHPSSYAPGFSVTGSAGLKPSAASGNTLAQITNMVETLQLGNPLTQTALIDVRARRIDLPADWMVSVSPAQVNLAPGEQTTVTVTVMPGSLAPQGSIPRVAVEGYAGSQLLGGVAVDIVVPDYVLFDGKLRVYLPVIMR